MRPYRVYFVHNNESKTRVNLGVVLEKNKNEGMGWARAYQLVARDVNNNLPHGHIEFEKAGVVFK